MQEFTGMHWQTTGVGRKLPEAAGDICWLVDLQITNILRKVVLSKRRRGVKEKHSFIMLCWNFFLYFFVRLEITM